MLSAALQHPNIIPVLKAGQLGGVPYFIMPYIEGESLRVRIKRGPLSVRETVNILKDVARALTFAHGRGIIHRDIKPDNVMLAAGSAIVADFGVAKALTAARTNAGRTLSPSITAEGVTLGTPAYMAPEQAAADPATDHRADIYSLGILAYEMLVGAPPFQGRTPQQLLAAQLAEKPPALTARRYDVPVPLSDLVKQCLEKQPALRPNSAASVLRALEDRGIVSGVLDFPVSARVRRRRVRAIVLTSLTLVAAATWIWTSRESESASAVAPVTTIPAPVVSRSIAVVPLESVGRDPLTRDVAQGIASELTSALTGISGLRVTSVASAQAIGNRLRDSAVSIQAPAVDSYIDGTVQRERSSLRVAVRFVDVARDSTIWAQVFQGTADSVLQLQARVVQGVTTAVSERALR
jgi:serine/threonine-protein kinase